MCVKFLDRNGYYINSYLYWNTRKLLQVKHLDLRTHIIFGRRFFSYFFCPFSSYNNIKHLIKIFVKIFKVCIYNSISTYYIVRKRKRKRNL